LRTNATNVCFPKGTQILFTDYNATIWKTVVAVCLTLSGPYILKIVLSTLRLLYQGLWQERPEIHSGEEDPLLSGDSPTPPETVSSILKHAHDGRDLISKTIEFLRRKGDENATFLVIASTIGFGIFVALTVAGVFSEKSFADRAALWSSERCGRWKFDSRDAPQGADARAAFSDRQKEDRAGQYAINCYEGSNMLPSERCSFFYRPNITYTVSYNWTCPFEKSICADAQAIQFDTGLQDSSVIGVNTKHPYKFRRSSSCAALSPDYPYVKNKTEGNSTTYFYYYGQKVDNFRNKTYIISEYTHRTVGNPFQWPLPFYQVMTYPTTYRPETDFWQPRAELKPPTNSTLAIIFVSAGHIYYQNPSRDPVFPTDTAREFDSEEDVWYYKSDPRARALACIDRTEFCTPDGKRCWTWNKEPEDMAFPSHYYMTKYSLQKSNIYDSIVMRLGSALIAQELVYQFQSAPLDDDHWMKEVERLWQTSLARISWDAWNMASGEDYIHSVNGDGYIDDTPDEAKEAGSLCGIFKFYTDAYTNVNFGNLIGWLLWLPAMWFLSRKARDVVGFVETGLDYVRRCLGTAPRHSTTSPNTHASAQQENGSSQQVPSTTSYSTSNPTAAPSMATTGASNSLPNAAGGNGTEGGQDRMSEDLLVFHWIFILLALIIWALFWGMWVEAYRKYSEVRSG
jgi:hypothetical protein